MKLTLKITLLFLIVACGMVGFSGYLAVRREVAFFEIEMHARHELLLVATRPTLRDLWRKAGVGGSLEYLRYDGSERQVRSRWVWLDETADHATLPVVDRALLTKMPEGRLTSLRYTLPEGSKLFCSYYPFALSDGRLGALEIAESLEPRDQYTQDTIIRTASLMAGLIAASGLLVAVFGLRLIARPLQALIDKTQRVAEGELRTPVVVDGNDELATLAAALNQMCDKLDASQQAVQRETLQRLDALEQLRHGDRLKTLGRLASGVAHELGTPLNVITGRAGLIVSGKLQTADVLKSVATIHSEATRMTSIVQQLLNFARRASPNRTPSNVNSIIERTVDLMDPFIRKQNAVVKLTARLPDEIRVNVDAGQLQQVLSNILMNAVLSKETGVTVEVRAEICEGKSPEDTKGQLMRCVRIGIADNGRGISPADLPHLFEPFFTTRDVGVGTGLGLSIAYGIVAEHNGWMTVESVPGHGSTFYVFLPAELEV